MLKCNNLLIKRLRNFFDKHAEYRQIFPYAIAKRIAYTLDMPSEVIVNERIFYVSSYDNIVKKILAEINEKMIFNTKIAEDMVYVLWKMRYDLVYNPRDLDVISILTTTTLPYISPDAVNSLLKVKEEHEMSAIKHLELLIEEGTVNGNV